MTKLLERFIESVWFQVTLIVGYLILAVGFWAGLFWLFFSIGKCVLV